MADADATIGWDNRDFKRGAREATKTLNKFEGGFSKSFKSIGKLAGPALAVGGLAKWGSAIFEGTLRLEELTVSLQTVSDGTESLDDQLTALRKTARLPGLGFEEAIEGSVRLQAAGLSAQQSREAIEQFGNALAAAGKGKADLDGVILALTQIAAKGKISAEEVNQIAERVPQIRAVMKEAFGTAVAEDIQKLGVSAEEFISKTIDALGGLARAGSTARNEMENAKDGVNQLNMALGEKLGVASLTSGIAGFFGESAGNLADDLREMGKELPTFEEMVRTYDIAGAKAALEREVKAGYAAAQDAMEAEDDALVLKIVRDTEDLEKGLQDFGNYFFEIQEQLKKDDAQNALTESAKRNAEDRLKILEGEAAAAQAILSKGTLQGDVDKLDFDGLSDADKLAKLKGDLAGVLQDAWVNNTDELRADVAGAEASGDSVAQVADLEALKAALILEKEIEAISKRIAETEARKWDDALAKGKEIVDIQKEAEDVSNEAAERDAILAKKREEFDLEQQILGLRAKGNDAEADAMQKALDIRRDAASIAQQLGISEAEALVLAKETADLKERANAADRAAANGADAGRSKIYKKRDDEKRLTRRSFGGLDETPTFSNLDAGAALQERIGNKGLLDKVSNEVGSDNKVPIGKAKDSHLSVAEKQLVANERTATAIENLTAQ